MANKGKNILSGSLIVAENSPEIIIKSVQSLIDAHVTYNGQISGKRYEWAKAGAIVEVDERDVPELLAKRRGKKPCCGQERPEIFQLA